MEKELRCLIAIFVHREAEKLKMTEEQYLAWSKIDQIADDDKSKQMALKYLRKAVGHVH